MRKIYYPESRNEQKGAVLVEFAILIPFLLLLLIGIAEIGNTYYHMNTLNKSVQDAARYFSHPLRARKGVSNDVIDLRNAASPNGNSAEIANTQNLAIYGSTSNTGSPILPNGNTMSFTIFCVEEGVNAINKQCLSTTKHIGVTVGYNHPFILGNLLNGLCGNCLPLNQYLLRASSVMRVEGG
jgi:Flp pilus assembly protein TadG